MPPLLRALSAEALPRPLQLPSRVASGMQVEDDNAQRVRVADELKLQLVLGHADRPLADVAADPDPEAPIDPPGRFLGKGAVTELQPDIVGPKKVCDAVGGLATTPAIKGISEPCHGPFYFVKNR